jgi:hypothetical protein
MTRWVPARALRGDSSDSETPHCRQAMVGEITGFLTPDRTEVGRPPLGACRGARESPEEDEPPS